MRQSTDKGNNGEAASSSLLVGCSALIQQLFEESGANSWGLTPSEFELALDRSARKCFAGIQVTPEKLQEYLLALHLKDLALACACGNGRVEAWDYFVSAYREYLRAAAAAILRCSAASPAACELADSLFADLYGLREGKPSERSLFRYFHGRSSLKTWLRAVLAQRHIDGIRAGQRFISLAAENEDGSPEHKREVAVPPAQLLADPHRERYLSLFTSTLEVTLGLLNQRDKERLRLYYAEELTLAEIGRRFGEHESSVSRNLERTRRELRREVEESLRKGCVAVAGSSGTGLSEDEISLCFAYAAEPTTEGAPIDLDKLFAQRAKQKTPADRQES
jgi:RNA polymerase sigma factor (sigma-70 family)